MVFVYLNTGECVEVQNAERAEYRNGSLVCLDHDGHVMATFNAADMESFTVNEEMAAAIKEEICDEVTVVGEDKAVGEVDPA